MKPLSEPKQKKAEQLAFQSSEVLLEGFRIDLSAAPEKWLALSHEIGGRRLCAAMAHILSLMYRDRFGRAFLFSEPCMTFELLYHLNAYLWSRGLTRRRHVSTLLLTRAHIACACHSVEIDSTDVYRRSQRLMFRYFFGVRKEYRRSENDPYAARIGKRFVRIPFYRLFRK